MLARPRAMDNIACAGAVEPYTLWMRTRESCIALLRWRRQYHSGPPLAGNGPQDTDLTPVSPCYYSPGLPIRQAPAQSPDPQKYEQCSEQFSQQLDKKTYVLLDNAPMHRSQAFIEQMPKWVKQGLIIKYLPPYSPTLNLIEILWRFMKYSWLPFSAYTSFHCLVAAVEAILTFFGT